MDTISERLTTCGDYQTEADAWAAFDAVVDKHPDVFIVLKEVPGWYVQPRINTIARTPRIDRILIPRPRLVEAGWTHGPIGVEGKQSNKKAGHAVSQAMDYSRAAFLCEAGSRARIMLEWIFLWPLNKAYCDIASIMLQNRIGCAHLANDGRLIFAAGETRGITISPDGSLFARELPMGRKVGSR